MYEGKQTVVSILSQPEGRELQSTKRINTLPILFQSSPSPKAGSYYSCNVSVAAREGVSILSQPEGRELLVDKVTLLHRGKVSILSQPEGRELLLQRKKGTQSRSFNPLPARRPGAT